MTHRNDDDRRQSPTSIAHEFGWAIPRRSSRAVSYDDLLIYAVKAFEKSRRLPVGKAL